MIYYEGRTWEAVREHLFLRWFWSITQKRDLQKMELKNSRFKLNEDEIKSRKEKSNCNYILKCNASDTQEREGREKESSCWT